MPVRIRLSRAGTNKRPFYRIVIADSRRARNGKFIERIGTYSPMLKKDNPERVKINSDRAKYWLEKGAQPSDRLKIFLSNIGIVEKPIITVKTKKHLKKKKAEKVEEVKPAAAKEEEKKAEKVEEVKPAAAKEEEKKAEKVEEVKPAAAKEEEKKAEKVEEVKPAAAKEEEKKAEKVEEVKPAAAKEEEKGKQIPEKELKKDDNKK